MACAKSELCIFDHALPQVVIENSVFEEIFPINTISGVNNSDIEFNIISSTSDYLDLNDTLLYIQVKVVGSDGKELAKDVDVTPSNYLFHTLFKDVVLSLNSEKIEGGNNDYTYKALLETILNYNNDTKKTSLTSIGYDESDAVRKGWIKESKVLNMCGSLQLDFFDQPKYLIPGVNVFLRLQRNASSFSLISPTLKPKIICLESKLYVRRVKVEPSVLIGHQMGLNSMNAVYPYRKTKFVSYTIASGSSSFYKDQIFGDTRLPKFILVTFQKASQYSGNYNEDISTYQHFNVSSITLSRNTDYRENYTQDFPNNNYITTYVSSMIRNMGHLDRNLNSGITATNFKSTYPFFTFVLAPDFDIYQTQLQKQGNLRIDIKFEAATESINLLVYGVFDADIQINKNRTILL